MRPIRLQITGLNSFRKSVTIEFDDLVRDGLFGIFGPTGSGKSTILDAITLALFGRVRRAPASLHGVINALETSCSVCFTFEIENHAGRTIYVAERLLRRTKNGGTETKMARLLEVVGSESIPLTDKTSEMRERVEELLGIKLDDFLRAVVLPQGQFAEFLGLEPSKRGVMLQGLFGLDRFGVRLQNAVKERFDRQSSAEALLLERIRQVADSDDAALLRAEEAVQDAAAELEKWRSILQCNDLVVKEAGDLVAIETSLTESREERNRCTALLALAQKEEEEMARHFSGRLPFLVDAIRGLERAISDRDTLEEKRAALADAEVRAITASQSFNNHGEAHQRLVENIARLEETVDSSMRLRNGHDEIDRRLSELQVRCAILREPLVRLEGVAAEMALVDELIRRRREECAERRASVSLCESRLAEAHQEESTILHRRDQLNSQLSDIEQRRILNLVRRTLQDGEPCPLCGALDHPSGDRHTAITDHEAEGLQQTLEQLEEEGARSGEKRSSLAQELSGLRVGLGIAEKELEEHLADHSARSAAMASIVAEIEVTDADGEREPEEWLRRKIASVESEMSACRTERSAMKERSEIDIILAAAQADLANDRATLDRLQPEMSKAKREEDVALHECRRLRSEIAPVAQRLADAVVDLVPKDERDHPIESVVEHYRSEHDDIQRRHQSAQGGLVDAQRSERESEKRYASLLQEKLSAEVRLADAQRALAGTLVAQQEDGSDPDRSDELKRLTSARDYAEQRCNEAVGTSAVAQERYRNSCERNKQWHDAIHQGSESTSERMRTEQLMKYLRGNRFVDFLANEHLAEVCRRASVQLGELTGGRYSVITRPEEGFVIEDRSLGGANRPHGSLSGGETFLVSLSLALALSDTMQINRGVPLEFFFLDEGFGTLDDELLDTVMSSLERLRSDRRSIGVISHVAGLRERISRQLVVDPPTATEGSRVRSCR